MTISKHKLLHNGNCRAHNSICVIFLSGAHIHRALRHQKWTLKLLLNLLSSIRAVRFLTLTFLTLLSLSHLKTLTPSKKRKKKKTDWKPNCKIMLWSLDLTCCRVFVLTHVMSWIWLDSWSSSCLKCVSSNVEAECWMQTLSRKAGVSFGSFPLGSNMSRICCRTLSSWSSS